VDAAELIRAVRRRWIIVAAAVAVALGAAWFTTRVVPTGPPVTTYQATSVLLSTGQSFEGITSGGYYPLRTLAALTTVGEVPERVAKALGRPGDSLDLAGDVSAVANQDTGLLKISATSTDPEEARVLADTFATELVAFLNDRSSLTSNKEAESVRGQLDQLEEEIAELNREIGDSTELTTESAERDAKVRQYSLLYERYQQLAAQNAATSGLQIIQDAVPIALPQQGLIQVRSGPSRFILAALLGLLAGVGIVFLLERFDTRIYTKNAAERHFDLPVLAEIPFVRRWKKSRSGIAATSQPKSHAADSFRILAAGVLRRPPQPPQAILITGPGPGEGKTTVAANLAAAFAEVGKKVLVVSADLHRPTIHTLFGVPNMTGLTEALRDGDGNGHILDGQKWRTSMSNVRLVPSGTPTEKPGRLLSSATMREVLAEAREVADVVILDTAPILAASDATHLFPLVDAVVVVARAGRTTAQSAERTTELLRRLGAPVVGVALNAATEAVLPRGYYQYYQSGSRRSDRGRSGSTALARLRGAG
jgi:capsular exopolysaccharide synthesis family protein